MVRIYPKDPKELREDLKIKIAGRTYKQLNKDGDGSIYLKANHTNNMDLIPKEPNPVYPEDPKELREDLKIKIAGRTAYQLIKEGDEKVYAKARLTGNLDLVGNKYRVYPKDPIELRTYLKKEIADRTRKQLYDDKEIGLYSKTRETGNLDLTRKQKETYSTDPKELREDLKIRIAGRTRSQMKAEGDYKIYSKAKKSNNLDLVKKVIKLKNNTLEARLDDQKELARALI